MGCRVSTGCGRALEVERRRRADGEGGSGPRMGWSTGGRTGCQARPVVGERRRRIIVVGQMERGWGGGLHRS
jgi:hypothetical protein